VCEVGRTEAVSHAREHPCGERESGRTNFQRPKEGGRKSIATQKKGMAVDDLGNRFGRAKKDPQYGSLMPAIAARALHRTGVSGVHRNHPQKNEQLAAS